MRSNAFEYVNWARCIATIQKKIQALTEAKLENGNPDRAKRIQEIVDDISKVWSALSKERRIDRHNQKGQKTMGSVPDFSQEEMSAEANISEAMGIIPSLNGLMGIKEGDVINLGCLGPEQLRPANSDELLQLMGNGDPDDNGVLKAVFSGLHYEKNIEARRKQSQELKQQLLKLQASIESLMQKPLEINQNFKRFTSYHLILDEIEQDYQELKNNLNQMLSHKASISVKQVNQKIDALKNRILILKKFFETEKIDLMFVKSLTAQSAEFQQNASTFAKGLRQEVAEHSAAEPNNDTIDLIDKLSDKEDEVEDTSQVIKAFQRFDEKEAKTANAMLKRMDKVNEKLARHSTETLAFIQSRMKALTEVSDKLTKIEAELPRLQKLLPVPTVKNTKRHRFQSPGQLAQRDTTIHPGSTVKPTPPIPPITPK